MFFFAKASRPPPFFDCPSPVILPPRGPGNRLEGLIAGLVVGEIQIVPEDHGVDHRLQQRRMELLPATKIGDCIAKTSCKQRPTMNPTIDRMSRLLPTPLRGKGAPEISDRLRSLECVVG